LHRIGNFFAAFFKKSKLDLLLFKKLTSNKTKPAFIFKTQWLMFPLPLPILNSKGLEVLGILGKPRIHNLPTPLIFFAIIFLADSI
jgi:hypothetical protein